MVRKSSFLSFRFSRLVNHLLRRFQAFFEAAGVFIESMIVFAQGNSKLLL
jgi:hypothetical protein